VVIQEKNRNKNIYVCSQTEIMYMISPYQIIKDFSGDITYIAEKKKKE